MERHEAVKRSLITGATLVVALFSFSAHAAMHWAPAPVKNGHGGHDRHAEKSYLLNDGEGSSVELITPKLAVIPITSQQGRVVIKPMGMDNYHALVATRNLGNSHESAVRYVYMFGKPSGESPSELMAYEKSPLEIEPAPYAREHWRYSSSNDALFVVRFRGQPLALTTVTMTTANGTSETFTTDAEGKLTVPLPEDFPEVKPGRMANPASELILTVRHSEQGQQFTTTFSADYHVNPEHWQSTSLGLATVFGGMLIGGLFTWRSKRRNER